MDPRHVREFTRRNRSAVHEAKAEYWAQRYREKGWYANWKLAQESWAYAKRVRPDLPTEDDRAEDFSHHLELKALLDRAAHGFASRLFRRAT